ncbi:uncharacterized protein LOC133360550 [Lethenteron reissneri]|uniref:uncharacterized protein LOC133360549 n=1 Tax=Lethenteron reissneri TaxID=7753 RepID=UPI002AB7DB54|nr:uncharacterized protein LOC133360549 [Lethenteron reissneri]XP_061435325.1 uncharacterized protein LOC133360550 [Lethenteron reissneri]
MAIRDGVPTEPPTTPGSQEKIALSREEEDQNCIKPLVLYDKIIKRAHSTRAPEGVLAAPPPALPVEVKTGVLGEKSTRPPRVEKSRVLRKGPRSKPRPRAHLQGYLKIFLLLILFFQLVGDTAGKAIEPSSLRHLQGQVDGIKWSCPNDETNLILVYIGDKLLVKYRTSGKTSNVSYEINTSLEIVDWDWAVPSGKLLWRRSPEDGVYSVEAQGPNGNKNTCIIANFTAAAETPTMPGRVQISYPSNETTSKHEPRSHVALWFVPFVPLVLVLLASAPFVAHAIRKRSCCKPETQREIDDDSCTTNGCLWENIGTCVRPRREYVPPQA